jgi:CheY-like chemotaxis protein
VSSKILLADDSVTVQKIVTLTFSDEGVDVVPVNSGDEAINRLQYMRPALVMADVSLPGKDGYEICEFVKSHPELKHTPVILLVPAFEPFDEERAARVGADHHLTKPFQSIRTLITTVKNLIEAPPKPAAEPIVWPTTHPPQAAQAAVTAESSTGKEAQDTEKLPEPQTSPALAASFTSVQPAAPTARWDDVLEADDVLELDDVLPPVQLVVAPPVMTTTSPANTITQAVKLTTVEAITTTSIPQSVIDEIAARVTAQVTLHISAQFSQLAAQMFEGLTNRLAQELAPRIAGEVLAKAEQPTIPPPSAAPSVGDDTLLDI